MPWLLSPHSLQSPYAFLHLLETVHGIQYLNPMLSSQQPRLLGPYSLTCLKALHWHPAVLVLLGV